MADATEANAVVPAQVSRTAGGRWSRPGWTIAAATVVSAAVALLAWAMASPVGASPDDDFHLISAWCAETSRGPCEDGATEQSRIVPPALAASACYAFDPEASAACQGDSLDNEADATYVTDRGNFDGTYPPLFYGVDGLLASEDLEVSVVGMRILNLSLFVGLATAASVLMPPRRRAATHLAWLITAVPLTVFFLSSNNPSGWAIAGIAVALPAFWGAIESVGPRRWVLLGVTLIAGFMATGSRADAAAYVTFGLLAVAVLAGVRLRRAQWPEMATVSLVAAAALAVMATTNQVTEAADGLSEDPAAPSGGLGLLGYNVLHLPTLWAGGFGETGLGWLDTAMPPVVTWTTIACFVGVMFGALRATSRLQAVALSGIVFALIALPLVVLQGSGDVVGANVQPRYLWPLIIMLALLTLLRTDGALPSLERLQLALLGLGLSGANAVALYSTMRRFITGTDSRAVSLNGGVEWWWDGVGSPMAWWALGATAFAVMAVLLLRGYVRASRAAIGQLA